MGSPFADQKDGGRKAIAGRKEVGGEEEDDKAKKIVG